MSLTAILNLLFPSIFLIFYRKYISSAFVNYRCIKKNVISNEIQIFFVYSVKIFI